MREAVALVNVKALQIVTKVSAAQIFFVDLVNVSRKQIVLTSSAVSTENARAALKTAAVKITSTAQAAGAVREKSALTEKVHAHAKTT